ncbi:MAG: outer membrane protein assembly factor BamA [Syntrophaceae bacterium]|nr:outer membrane protein assembly factor BamA [Syntrophaceae bacterium]
MTKTRSDVVRGLLGLFIALFLITNPHPISAQEPKKIALLPFEVFSGTQRDLLQESIFSALYAELAKTKGIMPVDREMILKQVAGRPLNEERALAVGKETGALYSIIGSVSEFGELISVDAKIIDIQQGKVLPGVFAQGRGLEGIPAMVSRLKGDLLLRIGEVQRIARVDFKGNQKIENSAIVQVIKSARGNVYSELDLSGDIKAIYKMGYFDDVKADTSTTPEGVAITFILVEKALISQIQFTGNKAIDKDELLSNMSVKTRQVLNPEKLAADITKLKNLYEGKGYYNAEITYKVEKAGEKDTRIVVDIQENKKIYVERISFEGNRTFTAKELRKQMKTTEWDFLHVFTDSGLLKKDELRQDVARLSAYYLNNGFIQAQVADPVITHDAKGIYIKIPINEGKRFRVGTVSITGDTLEVSRKQLMDRLEIKKKEFYDRSAIIKDIEALTKAANDEGFAYADVHPQTDIREKDLSVDVTYKIYKGILVYFNRITFTGNTKTRDKVMRRLLSIVEGDLYNSTNLKNSYTALERTRYFEEINFQTEKGPAENLTDVRIHIKEKATGMFSIGAGYSGQDNLAFMAEISQQNFLGRGQTLKVKTSLSSTRTWFEVQFIEPWLFDLPLYSNWNAWHSEKEWDYYNVNSTGGGFNLGYPLWEFFSGNIGYTYTIDEVKDINVYAPQYIQDYAGTYRTGIITVGINRDTTDDNFFPTRGSRNGVSVGYASKLLGGTTSYVKTTLLSQWFFGLPLDTVFSVRGRAGYLAPSEGESIPLFERFTLGGMNSLRGLKDIGPTDSTGLYVIGGTTFLCFNFEYLFPLIKEAGIKGVVFYDTGNAWDTYSFGSDFRHTTGAGIRWYSPLGPLRLEWGYVLDPKDGESKSRWEFAIGMFM